MRKPEGSFISSCEGVKGQCLCRLEEQGDSGLPVCSQEDEVTYPSVGWHFLKFFFLPV